MSVRKRLVGTRSDIGLCGVLDPLCLLSEDHTCRTDIGEKDWQGLCGALIQCMYVCMYEFKHFCIFSVLCIFVCYEIMTNFTRY